MQFSSILKSFHEEKNIQSIFLTIFMFFKVICTGINGYR